MENEQGNTNSDSDKELLGEQGIWIEKDVISVLIRAAEVFLDNEWTAQHESYGITDAEERYGHPFEQLLRLKRLVNELTYDLGDGYGLLGCCSQCKGNDGTYVQEKSWWGYCRLCEVRWLIDNVHIDERIAPLLNNSWIENMQATYHQVPLYAPSNDSM